MASTETRAAIAWMSRVTARARSGGSRTCRGCAICSGKRETEHAPAHARLRGALGRTIRATRGACEDAIDSARAVHAHRAPRPASPALDAGRSARRGKVPPRSSSSSARSAGAKADARRARRAGRGARRAARREARAAERGHGRRGGAVAAAARALAQLAGKDLATTLADLAR